MEDRVKSRRLSEAQVSDEMVKAKRSLLGIYLLLGCRGSKWIEVPPPMVERRNNIFLSPICSRFDGTQIKTQLAFMARWRAWCIDTQVCDEEQLVPSTIHVAAFLHESSLRGPTVALNLFGHLSWWNKWIGIPFHVEHPAVAALGVAAPGYAPQPKKPIELEAVSRLLQASMRGTGTVHLLMRACLRLAAAVVRFKHSGISRRLVIGNRLILFECKRGKRVSQGQRPPFKWALPRSLIPGQDMVGPLLTVYLELERALGSEVSFVVPDVACTLGKNSALHNDVSFLPAPMDYGRWVKVLRAIAAFLQLPAELATELWSTYTFRRLLPTIADILGLHEGHRSQLGEWTEQVRSDNSSKAVAAQPLMCHRYADCKVTTAGETKLLVASAISYASKLRPVPRTWEEFRETRTRFSDIDAFAPLRWTVFFFRKFWKQFEVSVVFDRITISDFSICWI